MEGPFKIHVNGQFEFLIHPDDPFDIIPDGPGRFHILQEGKAYHARVIGSDFASRSFTILVNGNTYELKIEDEYDLLVEKLGLSTKHAQLVREIKAPMPGLVLDIIVEPDQEVHRGDTLLILEAMKMENVIKCHGDGRISRIHVQKGAPVEKGQLLIELY